MSQFRRWPPHAISTSASAEASLTSRHASTMLRYPPSISSSEGTRLFCECARIWQNEYDLVTRNQPLYRRGTFFRDQQSRLPALQCSHDHPPSRGAHTKELAVSTCEAARSSRWPAMVVRCALATALNGPGQYARVRATFATADSCLANLPRSSRGCCTAESANMSIDEMVPDRHVFRAAVMPASCLSSTSRCGALFLIQ